MDTISITSPAWQLSETIKNWGDDGTYTIEQATEYAEAEQAWLVLTTGDRMRDWSFSDGTFTGPIRADAISIIADMFVESADYVIAKYDL